MSDRPHPLFLEMLSRFQFGNFLLRTGADFFENA
jgi:hypothetical protein